MYCKLVSTSHWLIQSTETSVPFSLYTIPIHNKAICFSQSSTEGTESSLYSEPDSVTLTIEDPVQEMSKGSQENLLPAWSLLLSQKQEFFNNHIARVRITPQPGKYNGDAGWSTFECRAKRHGHRRVSAVRSGGYRVSLGWSWLEHRCRLPTRHRYSFFPSTCNDFEICSMAGNPNLIDEEQYKETSPPPFSMTPVSERPTQPPVLMKSCLFGRKNENVSIYVYRKQFDQYLLSLLCMCFNKNSDERVSFHHNLFQKLVRHVCIKTSSSTVNLHFASSSKLLRISGPCREESGRP